MQAIAGVGFLVVIFALVNGIRDEGKKHSPRVNREVLIMKKTYNSPRRTRRRSRIKGRRRVEREFDSRNLNRLIGNLAGNRLARNASRKLLKRIAENPEVIEIILSAGKEFGTPADVMLDRWFLESSGWLGGDKVGVGRWNALREITKRTKPSFSRRWKEFRKNRRDLIRIARHCGYDLSTLRGSSTGALGGFQFMPSTFVLMRYDGNGDGKACPLNLSDAAYSASFMLSRKRARLRTWDAAIANYAGGVNVHNRQVRRYVARSRIIRRAYCRIIRAKIDAKAPCSI